MKPDLTSDTYGCLRIVALLALNLIAVLTTSASTPANPYPLSPPNPTDPSDCDAYEQRVSSIAESYNVKHNACLSANSNGPSIAATDIGVCSKANCQGLHDIVFGLYRAQAEDAVRACRQAVSVYQQQLQSQLTAMRRESQSIDRAADQLGQQVNRNVHDTMSAHTLADVLRQQAASDSLVRPSVTTGEVASLESAQRVLDAFKASTSLEATSSVAVNTNDSAYQRLVDAFKEKTLDLAMDALKSSSPQGEKVLETIVEGKALKQAWDDFETLADRDAGLDKRLDAVGEIASELNSRINPNPVSKFLFPSLVNYGIIDPIKGVLSAFDTAWASVDSPLAAQELQTIGTPGDISRYYPFLSTEQWPVAVTIYYLSADKFIHELRAPQ